MPQSPLGCPGTHLGRLFSGSHGSLYLSCCFTVSGEDRMLVASEIKEKWHPGLLGSCRLQVGGPGYRSLPAPRLGWEPWQGHMCEYMVSTAVTAICGAMWSWCGRTSFHSVREQVLGKLASALPEQHQNAGFRDSCPGLNSKEAD